MSRPIQSLVSHVWSVLCLVGLPVMDLEHFDRWVCLSMTPLLQMMMMRQPLAPPQRPQQVGTSNNPRSLASSLPPHSHHFATLHLEVQKSKELTHHTVFQALELYWFWCMSVHWHTCSKCVIFICKMEHNNLYLSLINVTMISHMCIIYSTYR